METEPIPGYFDNKTQQNYMNVPDDVIPILDHVKEGLSLRGANTLWSFSWAFRNMDSIDGNNQLDKNEFITGLAEWGIQISED